MNISNEYNKNQPGAWWKHLVAGGIAGAVSRTCTAPIDRLKIFLQVQQTQQKMSESIKYMLNEGGVRSLWRGNFVNVLKIVPETALKFTAYEQIKSFRKRHHKSHLTTLERFCAGALAGSISQTAIYPIEVLKTRLALRKTGQYSGIADATLKIYKTEGLKTFYKGYLVGLMGIVPYAGIDLTAYESFKRIYSETLDKNRQSSSWILLGCGALSNAIAQLCCYPLALIKTRLQAHGVKHLNTFTAPDNITQTMTSVFKTIIKNDGVFGLYRGFTPNFIKIMPAASINYGIYEYSSRLLGISMT